MDRNFAGCGEDLDSNYDLASYDGRPRNAKNQWQLTSQEMLVNGAVSSRSIKRVSGSGKVSEDSMRQSGMGKGRYLRIASHSSYSVVPQPLQKLDGRFHSRMFRFFQSCVVLLLFLGEGVPLWHHAGTNEQDISFARGHTLGFAHSQDALKRDRMC